LPPSEREVARPTGVTEGVLPQSLRDSPLGEGAKFANSSGFANPPSFREESILTTTAHSVTLVVVGFLICNI